MSRPGTSVVIADSLPAAHPPVDTGVAFLIGEAHKGPVDTPAQVRSPEHFYDVFGDRFQPPHLYDAVEGAFRDGVSLIYALRLLDAATATAATVDAGDFTVTARNPGEWANAMSFSLLADVAFRERTTPSRRRLALAPEPAPPAAPKSRRSSSDAPETQANGELLGAVVTLNAGYPESTVVERSVVDLKNVGDLIDWAETSDYVTIAGADRSVALTVGDWPLAGGVNGTTPVDDPHALLDAAYKFPPELGPGQLAAPGKTTPAQHEALLRAADYGNRVAVLDADPKLDEAGLAAHVERLRTLDVDYRGAIFDPRAVVPGRAVGTNRTVYWSGIQCGLINRQDLTGNPNRAAAGYFGVSRFAGALERQWDDDARERLMHAGVNTARVVYDSVRSYGFRSLVDENGPRREWLLFSNVRFAMAVQAKGDEIAERYVFEIIDGRQKTLSRFRGELAGMLMPYWPDALYGETPDEAFRVVTDAPVNTLETIAAGEIHAVIALRMNPFGEWVEVQIVKQPITQALA
jgi:hypothetical protein